MGGMDEISLAAKFINLFILAGVIFGFFYGLLYGVFLLATAVLGTLVKQPDEGASFFDGGGMDQPGPSPAPSRHRPVNPITHPVRIAAR